MRAPSGGNRCASALRNRRSLEHDQSEVFRDEVSLGRAIRAPHLPSWMRPRIEQVRTGDRLPPPMRRRAGVGMSSSGYATVAVSPDAEADPAPRVRQEHLLEQRTFDGVVVVHATAAERDAHGLGRTVVPDGTDVV